MDVSESGGYAFGYRDAVNSLSLLCIWPVILSDQNNGPVPSSNHHPCYRCNRVISLPSFASLSILVDQFRINQQGFDVDDGKPGVRMIRF